MCLEAGTLGGGFVLCIGVDIVVDGHSNRWVLVIIVA